MGEEYRHIPEDEFDGWLKPSEALKRLGMAEYKAARELVRQLIAGRISLAADLAWRQHGRREEEKRALIPSVWLSGIEHLGDLRDDFWDTGGITLKVAFGSIRDSKTFIECFEARFEPSGVLAPASAPKLTSTQTSIPGELQTGDEPLQKHAGGRPKWPGWEDLWIEIAAQLYCGDFQPTKQADLEVAMLTIAERSDDGPKIAVIRTRARRLWALIKTDG